jgi:hypothetical protein
MEKPEENCGSAEVPVRAFGMDADGKPFFEKAVASRLNAQGATVTRIQHALKAGEVIGIQYQDKKARFTILSVKPGFLPNTVEATVQIMEGQTVPWTDLASELPQAVSVAPRGSDKRRYVRHKISFPLTISFSGGGRSHMQCAATDIGGCGCYVESLVPMPIGSELILTFWIDSDKITTKGVVRASDPGVGMGIEFVDLAPHNQHKLQQYLEKMDKGFASSATQGT